MEYLSMAFLVDPKNRPVASESLLANDDDRPAWDK